MIRIAQMMVLRIPASLIAEAFLSIPKWEDLHGTTGFCRDSLRAAQDPGAPTEVGDGAPKYRLPYRGYDYKCCALPYGEHLRLLELGAEDPFVLIGVRDLGNNLFRVAWHQERGLFELRGENASTSGKEYTCLCLDDQGRLRIERLQFTGGKPDRPGLIWCVSGPELVWSAEQAPLWRSLGYFYDLRHYWRFAGETMAGMGSKAYRGADIEAMCEYVSANAHRHPQEVLPELLQRGEGMPRERDYLLNAMGLSPEGDVIVVQRHGSVEDLAATLIHAGAERGILLDEGGSVSCLMGGSKEDFPGGRTLLASHYHRPRGLALLVFKLRELDQSMFDERSALLSPVRGQG